MANCKTVCQLCPRLVISQAVTFDNDTLVINLPADRAYVNGERICFVVAQAIPDTVTINAPVGVTIGAGATVYPVTNRCCAQITACGIQTRTKYSAVVSVNTAGSGAIKLLGNPRYCAPDVSAAALNPGTDAATPAPANNAAVRAAAGRS